MDLPIAADPVAQGRDILVRVRKLLANYLPGMSCDRRRWRQALGVPMKEPALERERLFALGWLRWLEGDFSPAESLLAEANTRCVSEPSEEAQSASEETAPSDLPPLEPGVLLARSAYWCARVRVLLGRADALANYEAAMRRLGGSPQATAWYVDLLCRAGRIDRAEQVWKAVRTNKRVLGCDEGPLLDARSHLRKGEPGPAEKLLREASPPGSGVVEVERQLLLCWALTALRQADLANQALRLACDGPYPLAALASWRNLLERRRGEGPSSPAAGDLEATTAPGWRDFVAAQRLRAEGKGQEAQALYRSALGQAAVQPFARFGLACLGQDDAAAVLAAGPGLFFALRCRAQQAIDRFRRREINPAELLDVLGQASNAGYQSPAIDCFRQLAGALQQQRQPSTAADLAALVSAQDSDSGKRNAIRIVLELASRRLVPSEALELLRELVAAVDCLDQPLKEALGQQTMRLALLLGDPAVLDEAATSLSPQQPLLPLARALVAANAEPAAPEGQSHPVAILWQATLALHATGTLDGWREKVRGLRGSTPRAVGQTLLLQEVAKRGDPGAVGELLDEADAWRAFRDGPPKFVLRALEALAAAQPAHPVWRRALPRWLQLWDASVLGVEGAALAAVAGIADPGQGSAPPGVEPGAWFLHQAARALQYRNDATEALAFTNRALAFAESSELPSGEIVQAALPALRRHADARALADCLPETGTAAALLVDLVDLLCPLAQGEALLHAARRGDRAAVEAGLEALGAEGDLPGRLHHHLALLAMRAAQEHERRESPGLAAPLWKQAWRSWLMFLRSSEAPSESVRWLLVDHLFGIHRRTVNNLVARGEMASARGHWELVQSLPGLADGLAERVAKFRDDLATEYLLTTREAMRHGRIPQGWRADYERGLSQLSRLVSLDRDNVRLLTSLIEICCEWFIDLYNTQDAQAMHEQVGRYTPLALQLARLVADRATELPARAALAEFSKFRGFLENDPARKIALYREALRLDPGNRNIQELLAHLGVTDADADDHPPPTAGTDDR
jgi:hypothetical protein